MMKDMDKKGDLPLSLLATIGKQNSGSPRQASLSGPAASDSSRHATSFQDCALWVPSCCG